jgi:hypothetical protein
VIICGQYVKQALGLLGAPDINVGEEESVGPVQVDGKLYLIRIRVEEYTPSWMNQSKEGSK